MGPMTGGSSLFDLCFLGYSETDPVICPRKKAYVEERRAISWFQAVMLEV